MAITFSNGVIGSTLLPSNQGASQPNALTPYKNYQIPAQPISGGSVKGTSTGGGGSVSTPAPTGGGGNSGGGNSQPAVDPYAAIKSDISSSWDNYLNSLGGIQGDLNNQQTAQQGIANDQLTAGQNTINSQKANSLRDIANTTRSAFQAGNNYLGSMGAGDSSAANQYSFAINQQAGKQTGDLNNFVNTQLNQLQTQHDTQINSIANWFSQQQESLKQQVAQGQLQKGQDLVNLSKGILDQAINATNAIKQNTTNQYNALVSWAANNSQNVNQLQQNIAAIPQAMGQISLFGGNTGSGAANYGGTNAYANSPYVNSNQKTDIFGNPLQ